MRKNYCTTDLLICVTSITTCSDMSFNCLIKLCTRSLLYDMHFIVFDSLKRSFESGQPPRRGYSVTTSTTVSVSPSIVKRTSSPSKLKP